MGQAEIYSNPAEAARIAKAYKEAHETLDSLYETLEAIENALAEQDNA